MKQTSRLVGSELRKALGPNPAFWASLGVGLLLTMVSAVRSSVVFSNTLEQALRYWNQSDALYSATSCFSFWMPIDSSEWAMGVFVILWPLLAALPYAWSWSMEKKRGVLAQQASRASRLCCLGAKAMATFASSALAVGVPLVVNLVACACIAPASNNWVSDVLYLGVTYDAPLSSLFYNVPLLFCILWTIVVAIVAGLWAAFVLSLTMLTDTFASTLIASYLVVHVLSYVGSQFQAIALTYFGERAARSALLSLDLLSIVSVRSVPDATGALVLSVFLLALLAAALFAIALRRDIL